MSVLTKTIWISKWMGKVACEIFCFSSGKIYRSKEMILVLQQSLVMRVEFQFRSQPINLSDMSQYFAHKIHPMVKFTITIITLASILRPCKTCCAIIAIRDQCMFWNLA